MRETRLSGSVEGVVGDHDSYSDSLQNHSQWSKHASGAEVAATKCPPGECAQTERDREGHTVDEV